jgi:hypothetical protein
MNRRSFVAALFALPFLNQIVPTRMVSRAAIPSPAIGRAPWDVMLFGHGKIEEVSVDIIAPVIGRVFEHREGTCREGIFEEQWFALCTLNEHTRKATAMLVANKSDVIISHDRFVLPTTNA